MNLMALLKSLLQLSGSQPLVLTPIQEAHAPLQVSSKSCVQLYLLSTF